ncbi:receptor-like protein Cf-9 homolog [Gossypium raimondii]|uniref:receptor-like protein Cf-9 homolog n=1 Tax=Gossypium raimondii TaxID=29730 RepID=UPI00227D2540|nr:receptor-like protein Cf-9 homolog [Gossypium raimondii]
MRSLRELYLDGVNISSPSSEWCETTSLSLPKLSVLSMSNCDLSGHFPAEFFLLPKMQRIDISGNSRLMGQLPEFPINNSLEVLSLRYTNFSGKLPESISNLKLLRVLILSKLGLNFNSSSGSIPASVANLSNLMELDLSHNNFNGSIPPFHRSGVPNLASLDLSWNHLSGSIPSSLFTFSTLQTLSLGYNNFSDYQLKLDSSSIPDFGGATLLSTLQLNDNKLEGKLPRSLANCTSLKILNLGNNTLHDTFPLWLGKLPRLMVLILRANRFYGPIKHLENNFPALDVLDITSNKFFGKLSIEFFQAIHKLRSLKINGNNLEGKLPKSLANCRNLEVLDLGKNMIHDTFPYWLVKLPLLKVLILRSNRFYGSIKFSGDGNAFPMLHILDLASNNFSALGSLTELESLDLSQNSLSRKIPLQLTSLTFLGVLNLSYNQLDGSISQRYQFGTFLNDSYIGNTRLCGVPLTKKCNEVGSQMLPQKEGEDSWIDGLSIWKVVLMGYGCGLVIVFSIGYTVLNEFGNKWIASFIRKWKRSR